MFAQVHGAVLVKTAFADANKCPGCDGIFTDKRCLTQHIGVMLDKGRCADKKKDPIKYLPEATQWSEAIKCRICDTDLGDRDEVRDHMKGHAKEAKRLSVKSTDNVLTFRFRLQAEQGVVGASEGQVG